MNLETSLPHKRIAIIDLGSNTARLIVLESVPGYAFRLVDEIREVTRLREGMTKRGLSEEAMTRGLSTLRLFKRFCDATNVDHIIAVATSAVREGANGATFLSQVRREVGLTLHILDGEREAYYAALGALNEIPIKTGYVVDIGGGSAQVGEIRGRDFYRGFSAPLGALALTESFVHSDPISKSDRKAVQAEIDRRLDEVSWLKPRGGPLIGVGGTIRNLARMQARRTEYPLGQLHGFELTLESIEASIDQFVSLPLADRQAIVGLNSDRADIILPGALVIRSIMKRVEAPSLTISVNGIREGLFFEHFWAHLASPILPDVRRFALLNMARLYDYQKDHVNHVRYLAGRIFEQLSGLHQDGSAERELLDAAAMLHDLGVIIDYEDHHKHSETLIAYRGLPGFSPREQAIVALLARYHRRGMPRIGIYASLLSEDDMALVQRLAAILRLAEFLERGRNAAVDDVSVTWDEEAIRLTLIADIYPAVEMWQTEHNALPLMTSAFSRRVTLDSIAAPY